MNVIHLYLFFTLLITSCQEASFDAESEIRQPAVLNPPVVDTPTVEDPPVDPDEIFDDTPNDLIMNKCFKEWGETPFDATTAKNYRVLSATGVGFGAPQLSDRTKTSKPSLVLVRVQSQGFTSINLDLGNPNGWYCIYSTAVGFTSISLKKHCRATIGNFSSQNTGFSGSQTQEYGDDC